MAFLANVANVGSNIKFFSQENYQKSSDCKQEQIFKDNNFFVTIGQIWEKSIGGWRNRSVWTNSFELNAERKNNTSECFWISFTSVSLCSPKNDEFLIKAASNKDFLVYNLALQEQWSRYCWWNISLIMEPIFEYFLHSLTFQFLEQQKLHHFFCIQNGGDWDFRGRNQTK